MVLPSGAGRARARPLHLHEEPARALPRQRPDSREVFERLVEQRLAAGLASAEHVAVDGSHVQASADHHRRVAGEGELPREAASRAARGCRKGLDGELPDLEGVERTAPRHLSLTDPAAAWSINHGPGRFACRLSAMLDAASGIGLDVQAAPARLGDERKASQVMVERLPERHGLTPRVLAADKAYGSRPFLAWLEARERGSCPGDRAPWPA